ncbi:kinesin-like protein CG14535 isoform X1 [Diachasma alloeum]|uniref:kinesin-like protein CG14535 isoform X1 n=1 Tax=Diachasma alloeum TaxID=454923 RepID=UPI0007382C26|nr:kinesin-like protein CG14535 isoform X1 [Diachasma alloeum]
MDMTAERPRTAGRIAPSGRVTPTVHKSNNARRKAIPVLPPRVPTPMPSANNNHQRSNANMECVPVMPAPKIEHQGNIDKIAKRYLDDNMQQAWINPRLISMINMEAVTSTDYESSNLTRSFNQMGFSTYNYLQFEEKYKSRQYLEHQRNPIKPGFTGRTFSRHSNDRNEKIEQNYSRSHSQPEKPHHLAYEARSRSQECREQMYYQVDGPGKPDSRHTKCHRSSNEKNHDNAPNVTQEKKESKLGASDKAEKRDKSCASIHAKHNHVRQEQKINGQGNQLSKPEPVECHLVGHQRNDDPPKYRPLDRPPKYQEDAPRTEPPPKYCEVTRRQEDVKKCQEEKVRRQVGTRGGSGLGAEAPTNLTSITPTAREPRGTSASRQRSNHKQNDVDTSDDQTVKAPHQQSRSSFNGTASTYVSGGVILGVNSAVLCPEVMIGCPDSKFKGVESYLKSDKQKVEKVKCDTGKLAEKIKTVQDAMYKPHEPAKTKGLHEPGISHVGYKADNIKYYGELKGFKSYGAIDKPQQYASSDKGHSSHDKSHARSSAKQCDKSAYSDKYSENYYHRPVYLKSPALYPPNVFQETKYAYSVSGVPGTPAQASAAAAFFARAAQKWNLSSSPHRRRRSGDENVGSEEPVFPNGYGALLLKSPPPAPPAFLRRIGVKEMTGVGKVKVMLRVSSGEGGSFFNADKRKKQVTLVDPTAGQSSTAEDRRPTVAAPKMFAFDAIFTEEDSQTEICSSALTDVIHAVINGTDGCLFCFGHAGLGKSHTMLGTPEAGHTLGAIPCAITWLFRGIAEQRQRTGARFSVRVSCVELTTGQQQLKDLLAAYANDSEQSPAVYLRDDPFFGSLSLQQHSEIRAPTAERAAFYLDAAVAGRQREDSDAHMLYTLHVYQYSVAGKGGVAGGRSRLHLMDLGNSDRGKAAGGIPLSGLGNILLAIFNGQKHLPYKEHKLTQLLKECLGSLTCHAAMIAHVSPNAQHYTETLTTVQLASRIHRMRRRKIKFVSGGAPGNGSGGSSGEEAARQTSECDPSSSDLSADTVIYVGPGADDATDGEHPPVYLPSLNSGDNRCAMGRALRGSAAERPTKIPEERSPAHKANKAVKSLTQTASKQTSPAHSATPKASPARKMSSTKVPTSSSKGGNDSPTNTKLPAGTTGGSDEQWIDGPRISKSKVAEARHLLKEAHHKRETWIDGPMQLTSALPGLNSSTQHGGYGFMDNHKKIMIRKWVENQSSQIQRAKHAASTSTAAKDSKSGIFRDMGGFRSFEDGEDDTSLSTVGSDSLRATDVEDCSEKHGAKLNLLNIKSNDDSGLDLTASPGMEESIGQCRLDSAQEDEDDDEEIVVPPPLPLIEPLSNGVSREVSMESLNLSHKDILPSRHSLSSEDEILEIVEVEDLEPVPMQDSCLQVTEEDIAFCMGENPLPESDQEEHPLRILSQENLTIVSTFTDSMSVMSDSERYKPQFQQGVNAGMGVLPRPYFDHEDFLEQETRHKFDQLARLHELYQSKLALANVSNSVTYQRENSSAVSVRDGTSNVFRPPSRCQSLSLSDVLFNDNASNHGSIYSEPAYVVGKDEQEKICDNCRQSMSRPATASYWYPSSVAHLASPRRFCGKLGECNISSLRHPDGASNPNLKEEIERIPGNGASGSDPEEEYIEAKKLFTTAERSERTVTGKSDIEEEMKVPVNVPLQLSIPSSLPSSGRMQRKLLSLGSSYGLSRESYDSGADSTPKAAKLSPATLSRHRAESSGYDSVVRDSETSSIASDSSRQTSALQDHQAVGQLDGYVHQEQLEVPVILVYTDEDVEILDRRGRLRSEPRGTMSRINSLRLRQRLLKIELRNAKKRLSIPDDRWTYDLHVEDSMDWRDPSFLEALEAETSILQKRVEACKSHVLLVTCFDSHPTHRKAEKRIS